MNATGFHIHQLTRSYPSNPDLTFELRCFNRKDNGKPFQRFYPLNKMGTETAEKMALVWRSYCDIFIGVLPRIKESGFDKDIPYARFLWVDIDAGESSSKDAANLIRNARVDGQKIPKPRIVVESGSGGGHLYFELEKPISLDDAESRQTFSITLRRLCKIFGGTPPTAHADISCVNPSRILRLAGTLNLKSDPAKEVRLQHVPDADILSYEWWQARLPIEREYKPFFGKEEKSVEGSRFFNGPTPRLERWADEPITEGQRHDKLVGHARWLKKECGLNISDAYHIFIRKVNASNKGTKDIVTEAEAEGIWKWA